MTLQVGDRAPDFSLPDTQGTLRSLADFRGQWIVLYFYPKDNTPGCTKEACGFRDEFAAFGAANAVILGVSPNDEASHQKFVQKYDLPFLLLCDPEAAIAKQYESYGPKKFMGKEYDGFYRHTFIMDPEGKVAKIYRKVKPEPHAQEVLTDLTALQAAASA
jgi:thioredoxin-dependent peroxiredoxin